MTNTEIKDAIIVYLMDKGNWQDTDIELINQLFYNKYLIGQAKKKIREYGVITVNDKGNIVKNPAVSIYKQASNDISNILTNLGITPAVRRKLKLDIEKKYEDEFAKEFD